MKVLKHGPLTVTGERDDVVAVETRWHTVRIKATPGGQILRLTLYGYNSEANPVNQLTVKCGHGKLQVVEGDNERG